MLRLLLGPKFTAITAIVTRALASAGVGLRGKQIKLPKKITILLAVLLVVITVLLPALFGGGGTDYAKPVGDLADSVRISLSAFSRLTPEIEAAQNEHVRDRILSHGDEMCSLEAEQAQSMRVVVAGASCRPGAAECTLVAQGLDEDGSVINVYPYPASGVMLTTMSDIHAALLAYVTNLEKIAQAETIEEAKTTRFAAFGAAEAAAKAVEAAATRAIKAAKAKEVVARVANMTANRAIEDAFAKVDNAEKITGEIAGSVATKAVDNAINAARDAADKIKAAATAEAARAAASAKAVEVVEAAEEATAKAIEAVEGAGDAGGGEPGEDSDVVESAGNGRPLAEAGVGEVDKNSVAAATDAAAVTAAAVEAAGVAAAEAAEGAVAKFRNIDEDDVTSATRLAADKAGRVVEDAVSEATEAAKVAAVETARESAGGGFVEDIAAKAAKAVKITKVAVEAVIVKTTEDAAVAIAAATDGARKAEKAAATAVKAAAGDARIADAAKAAAAAARASVKAAEAIKVAQVAVEAAGAVIIPVIRATDVKNSITDNLDGQAIPLEELRNIPYVGGMFANVIEIAVVHHVDSKKKDYLAEVTRGTQGTLDILEGFYEKIVIAETTHALKTMHDSFLCEQKRFNSALTLDRFVAYVAAAKKYDAALKAVMTNPFKPFAVAHGVLKDQLNSGDDQPDGKVITLSNVFAALQKFRADALSFEDIVSVLPNRAEPYGENEVDDGGG